MPKNPSKKQREVFNYVEGFIQENGFSPSLRDIQAAFNLGSVSTAAVHIDNLVKLGMLRKIDNHARTLEVVSTEARGEKVAITEAEHLNWLRKKIAEYEKSPDATRNAEILKAALTLLDQTDNT